MNDRSLSIFFIDDDKFLLDMYAVKFSKSGYEVRSATSPDEALKVLKDGFAPDILILDIVMPGMDGLELLERIRKEGLATKSVVVMLTNQNSPADIARAQKLNVSGYIIKASSIPSEVLEEVAKIYHKTAAPGEAAASA
jgi:two-component system sensor histidine kinase ChiS